MTLRTTPLLFSALKGKSKVAIVVFCVLLLFDIQGCWGNPDDGNWPKTRPDYPDRPDYLDRPDYPPTVHKMKLL